jgi:hypothetical protein
VFFVLLVSFVLNHLLGIADGSGGFVIPVFTLAG